MNAGATADVRRAGRDASAWTVADLERDTSWVRTLTDGESSGLADIVRSAHRPGKAFFDYRRSDFPFDARVLQRLRDAVDDVQHGRGIALIRGLPREDLSASEYELLTWALGLHLGVARPQDRFSRYINAVKDVGVDYRSPTGRGYSSKAELDFHVDGGDVVLLSCYNQAPVGGDSLCASSVAAWRQLATERPDLAAVLEQPVPFSRQGEQLEGEDAFYMVPVFARSRDDVVCFWNRNRIANGFKLPGAPARSEPQREAMDLLDEILRRPQFMYSMRLQPGDLQILSNYTVLHSRTSFEDHADEARKRILFRLWLATPNGLRLPSGLAAFEGVSEPGWVRGGSRGLHYDETCRDYEQRQAALLGMRVAEYQANRSI